MKQLSVLIMLFMAIVTSGCTQVDTGKTYDREGNEVFLPESIERVITVGASITEILVELGLADKIVGADTYSIDIGGMRDDVLFSDTFNPDVEKMVELRPDAIIVSGMAKHEGTDMYKPFSDVGIAVIYIPTSTTIKGIREDIIYISELFDVQDKGNEIIANLDYFISAYKAIGETISDDNRKTVYFEIEAGSHMYTFGNDAFLSEVLTIIGAENIFADETGWIRVSDEQIIAKNPDVIISNVNYIDNVVEEIKSRSGWENITAVANGDVYFVDANATSRPSHNIIRGMEQIARVVYPEKYKW